MKTFIGITGTTCVGKSDVAILLAQKLHCDVISADSAQVYVGMDIGTAKVTQDQMQGVKHYLLDVAKPDVEYSSYLYQQQASAIIDKAERPPIVVGGTGFYFDSLLYPPEFGNCDKALRNNLQQILATQGLSTLQQMLLNLDEKAYNTVDICNPVRVIRAIEIAESGASRTNGSGRKEPKYDCKLFVLQRNRDELYKQIDKRVDSMIDNGLVDEVHSLYAQYGNAKAFSAIGYKEIIEYLNGNCTLTQAVEQIKLNTRHYAKRQITYFKKMSVCAFIDVDGKTAEQVAEQIFDLLTVDNPS